MRRQLENMYTGLVLVRMQRPATSWPSGFIAELPPSTLAMRTPLSHGLPHTIAAFCHRLQTHSPGPSSLALVRDGNFQIGDIGPSTHRSLPPDPVGLDLRSKLKLR